MTRKALLFVATGALLLVAASSTVPWAVDVPTVVTAPFSAGDPLLMTGPPEGGGATMGSIDIYQLGVGGQVVLELGSTAIDGPGADLVVYENPFYVIGQGTAAWIECVTVEVSSDASHWARFPTRYDGPVGPFKNGALFLGNETRHYRGFAGVMPAAADPAVGIDPFDLVAGGGDAFDLVDLANDPAVLAGDVDLEAVRYVRLTDVEGGVTQDDAGSPVWDCGDAFAASADVDAVAVLNSTVDIAGTAGRPRVELSLQEFGGQQFVILELGDTDGLWTIQAGITASGDGFPVDFYTELLPLFVLLGVDSESAVLAAGPVPPDLQPVLLKVAVEDFTGQKAGDALYLP
jgi:hypothetical protein